VKPRNIYKKSGCTFDEESADQEQKNPPGMPFQTWLEGKK
jgi:hypothetical protein